jgi:hypothetical protein
VSFYAARTDRHKCGAAAEFPLPNTRRVDRAIPPRRNGKKMKRIRPKQMQDDHWPVKNNLPTESQYLGTGLAKSFPSNTPSSTCCPKQRPNDKETEENNSSQATVTQPKNGILGSKSHSISPNNARAIGDVRNEKAVLLASFFPN